MIQEDQLNVNTTESKLLYDIRSEMRKNNELLTQLLEVLRPMRKDTGPKEVKKPRASSKTSKEETNHESHPKSNGRVDHSNPSGDSAGHPGKRKTVHDKQSRSTTPVLSSDADSNGGKRVSRSSRNTVADKNNGKG